MSAYIFIFIEGEGGREEGWKRERANCKKKNSILGFMAEGGLGRNS